MTEENELKSPNVYKGMMGLMDLTYKEISGKIGKQGTYVGDISEICRAVRGFPGPKYDKIRRHFITIFVSWLKELDEEGQCEKLKPYVSVSSILNMDTRSNLQRMQDARVISMRSSASKVLMLRAEQSATGTARKSE